MEDAKLMVVIKEIDDLLTNVCVKHEISPLSLAAIINARLIWACKEGGLEHDFFKLLETISEKQHEPTYTNYGHH